MNVGVLGALRIVDRRGNPVVLASAAQRRLLALLSTKPGSVMSADRLGDALGISTGGLHTAVSRLRKSLGADVVVTEPPGYALLGIEVDAAVFEERLALARTAQAEQQIGILSEALALWRGEAFLEFADEDWARGAAVRLSELRAFATEDLADALIVTGAHAAAVAVLVEHVDRHPLRDHPRGLLMRALVAQGRQSEALRAYRSYRRYLGENIGTEPSSELQELERQIASGRHDHHERAGFAGAGGVRMSSPPTHNLRAGHNGYIERPEVDDVLDMLGAERWVTVVGPGGMGKSRLADAVGKGVVERWSHGLEDRWRDGVWFVDLAPLRAEGAEVARVVAEALGLQRQPGLTATETVIEFLRHRDVLLILDNCERVLDSSADFATRLMSETDSVTGIATSRVRLGLNSERVLDLEPLSTDAALRLFDTRVAEIGSGPFPAGDGSELCALLDNYPLAIELAAGRCRALTAAELSARLRSRPDLLRVRHTAERGATGDRHASLTAALEWSLEQLDPATRTLLERAAVFSSDFDLIAAEAILPVGAVAPDDVVEHLEELVEHHLVRRDHRRGRFRILEPIRQIVSSASTSDADLIRRHGTYFVGLMTDVGEGILGPNEAHWLARLHAELPHFRDAIEWAIAGHEWWLLETMMQRMALAIELHHFIEAGDWAERVLAASAANATDLPATALTAAAGRHQMERFDACETLLSELEEVVVDGAMWTTLCVVRHWQLVNQGDSAAAFEWYRSCSETARREGDELMATIASLGVAEADAFGNPSLRAISRCYAYALMDADAKGRARGIMGEAYAAAQESTNPFAIAWSALMLGAAMIRAGDVRGGAIRMAEGVDRLLLLRSPMLIWNGVESIANSLVTADEPYAASVLWATIEASERAPYAQTFKDPTLAAAVERSLTEVEAAAAQREGSILTMDAAVALARTALEKLAGEPAIGH